MGNTLVEIFASLVHLLFTLYITAFMLRLMLAWTRANFANPLVQSIVRVTDPLLKPARRAIPSIGGIDSASIIIMLILKMIGLAITWLILGRFAGGMLLFTTAILQLIELAIYIYLFAIFIQIISSWIVPAQQQYGNPILGLLHTLTEPLMRPARRLIPPIGALDLSPMAVIFLLYALLRILQTLHP